jgi:Trehalose utilisation
LLVVERGDHVAAGKLAARLGSDARLSVTAAESVPVDLTSTSVLILNSLSADFPLAQDRIVNYLQSGGGILSLHDTLFPSPHNQALLAATGVRYAFEAITIEKEERRFVYHLAAGNPDDLNLRFPLRVVQENATHPIVATIKDFEVADELWAINIAPGVKPLLIADVGDRVPCHQRFRQAVPVCGCRGVDKGR